MQGENPFRIDRRKGTPDSKKSSAGVPPAIFPLSSGTVSIRNRGHLPHWESATATYFVTFRLADSLPQKALQKILFARKDIPATAAQMGRALSDVERKQLKKLNTSRIEKYLDEGVGGCFFRDSTIARVVVDSLHQFHGTRYQLFAWCVMPNHVHVVFKILSGNTLPKILHSWKSFSAKKANKILGRSSQLWQREYYDHMVRDEVEFHHAVQYVIENPERAGLIDWPWVWPV
jgi:REP element-mobilizing transposase RayT